MLRQQHFSQLFRNIMGNRDRQKAINTPWFGACALSREAAGYTDIDQGILILTSRTSMPFSFWGENGSNT